MTGGVYLAVFEQLVEPFLGGASVVERHTVSQRNEAGKISGAHVVSMPPHINLGGVRSERTSVQINLVVTHRRTNLINVVGKVRRRVLTQIIFFLQLVATGARGSGIERAVQVRFQIVIRPG